ncbi:hypothetical protein ACFPK9_06075 [Rubritalea spongiae]|uniref:Uncharacterized protein n=1 Tax=Rubritalea spongiae TaxID=430797 RepID=A0ABW5E3T1_9BACT
MEKPSSLTRCAQLRRRVHGSWKTTLLVAIAGGGVLAAAGLAAAWAVFVVMLCVALVRPVMEVYFSHRAVCPHCEADLFLEMCEIENMGGIEGGLRCPSCGRDASKIDSQNGPVIDIEEYR